MNKLKEWLTNLLKEDGAGSDVCIVKCMAIIGFVAVLGYGFYHGAAVMEFAQSVSLALGSAAGGIGIKNASTKS